MEWYLGKPIKLIKSSLINLDFKLSKLNKKIDLLNKRNPKLNFSHITYEIIKDSEFTIEETLTERKFYGIYNERKINVTYILINIVGLNPKIKDYRLISKIEKHPELNEFQFFPFIEELEKPKMKELYCEHCQSKRDRKFYFQLRKENGKDIIVGKSCLKYYNNMDEISKILIKLNSLFVDYVEKDFLEYQRHFFTSKDLEEYLKTAITSFLYLKENYSGDVKKELYMNLILVLTQSGDLNKKEKETVQEIESFYSKNKDLIDQFYTDLINYFKSYNGKNNFKNNIRLELSLKEQKPLKNVKWGLLRYSPFVFLNEKYKKKEYTNKSNNFFSNVGEKFKEVLIYDKSLVFDGFYGNNSFMHFFYNLKGDLLIWSTSKSSKYIFKESLNKGDKVILSGKIKKHETYNEINQTFITRCKNQSLICYNN